MKTNKFVTMFIITFLTAISAPAFAISQNSPLTINLTVINNMGTAFYTEAFTPSGEGTNILQSGYISTFDNGANYSGSLTIQNPSGHLGDLAILNTNHQQFADISLDANGGENPITVKGLYDYEVTGGCGSNNICNVTVTVL